MLTIISVPTDFVSKITANASDLFSDLAGITTLIVGVLLAVLVIGVIIHFIKK